MKAVLFKITDTRRLTACICGSILFLISGCSTIEFVQHEQNFNNSTTNRWHHSTLNGIVEISKPLNIQSICGTKAWTTITSQINEKLASPKGELASCTTFS
jgi:hypothetical protein